MQYSHEHLKTIVYAEFFFFFWGGGANRVYYGQLKNRELRQNVGVESYKGRFFKDLTPLAKS